MALFKMATAAMLWWLCIVLAIGSANRTARGSDLYLLFVATLAAAAVIALAVRMVVSAAEAASLPPGADAVARAAAESKGVGSIATRWKRAALRGMLLVGVGISGAASFLAVDIFELEGRSPIAARVRWAMVAGQMVIVALIHGLVAWVAVRHDD